MPSNKPRTIIEKVWDSHMVAEKEGAIRPQHLRLLNSVKGSVLLLRCHQR